VFAPRLAQQIGGQVDKPAHQALSDRELEVMLLMARGKRIKDIAGELSLSIKTVSTHRQHILQKLKLSNNAEMIRYALKNRLVD
jgi:DNA-binding NarL/FixJ family response regulator